MTSAVIDSTGSDDVVGTGVRAGYASSAVKVAYRIPGRPSLAVRLAHADGRWTAAERRTGIFGAGETLSEAIKDFMAAVVEHRDVLERQPALSPELESQLHYLRELLGDG